MTKNRHALSDEKWPLVRPFIPKRRGRHGAIFPKSLGIGTTFINASPTGVPRDILSPFFKAVQQPDMEEAWID